MAKFPIPDNRRDSLEQPRLTPLIPPPAGSERDGDDSASRERISWDEKASAAAAAAEAAPSFPSVTQQALVLEPMSQSAAASAAAAAGVSPPVTSKPVPAAFVPSRDIQSEIAVLKAVRAREDSLERLKAATEKMAAAFASGTGGDLSMSIDPLARLFFRWATNSCLSNCQENGQMCVFF